MLFLREYNNTAGFNRLIMVFKFGHKYIYKQTFLCFQTICIRGSLKCTALQRVRIIDESLSPVISGVISGVYSSFWDFFFLFKFFVSQTQDGMLLRSLRRWRIVYSHSRRHWTNDNRWHYCAIWSTMYLLI